MQQTFNFLNLDYMVTYVSVILGHPHPNSFNHAIAHTVVDTLKTMGYVVRFHDLYAEGFNPVLPYNEIPKSASLPHDIQQHCVELSSADGIVIVHPNWWGQPPAILKGWIDRVIRPGTAYMFEENDKGDGVPIGLLKAQKALVLNTSNTPKEREKHVFGDPLQSLWNNCIFDLCGVKEFYRKMYGIIVTSTVAQRISWLEDVSSLTRNVFKCL
jgi:putative NADPH-quinone reductase